MCQFPAQWCAGNSPKKVYHYLPSAAELECAAYPDAPDSTNNRFLHGCHHHRCHIDSAVSVYYYCHEASEYLLQIFQATVQHRRLKVSSAFNPLAKPFTFYCSSFENTQLLCTWSLSCTMYPPLVCPDLSYLHGFLPRGDCRSPFSSSEHGIVINTYAFIIYALIRTHYKKYSSWH